MSNIAVTEIKQHIKIDGADQIIQPAEESFQVLLTDGEINVHVQADEGVIRPITIQEQTQKVEIVEELVSIIKVNGGPKGDPGIKGDTGGIASTPPSGGYIIANFYLNASKHIVIVYDETPVT